MQVIIDDTDTLVHRTDLFRFSSGMITNSMHFTAGLLHPAWELLMKALLLQNIYT